MLDRLKKFPKEWRWRAQTALDRIGLPYIENNPFRVPGRIYFVAYYVEFRNGKNGAIDFTGKYRYKGKPPVPPRKENREKAAEKLRLLTERGFPYLLLDRKWTVDKMEMEIRRWILESTMEKRAD